MKKSSVIIIIVVLSVVIGCVFTALGAFLPIWLETYESVYDMRFGLPFAFAEQTTDMVFNADYFPRYFPPQYFHDSFETVFIPEMFVLSLTVNILAAAGICVLIYFIHRSYRKKHPKPQREKDEYKPVFD